MNRKELEQHIKNSYNIKAPDYWNRIENADMSKVPQIAKRKGGWATPFYRIATAVACLALVITAMVAAPKIFNDPKTGLQYPIKAPDSALNYNRVGTDGIMFTSYYEFYSFSEVCKTSHSIVDLTIVDWLGEDDEGMPKTFFKAKINHSFKGALEKGDEILIRQDGNSKLSVEGFPLFSINDSIIAFLRCGSESDYYFLVNGDEYVCDIIEYEREIFAVKRRGTFAELSSEKELAGEIVLTISDYAKNRDKTLFENNARDELYTQIFLMDDLIDILEVEVNE